MPNTFLLTNPADGFGDARGDRPYDSRGEARGSSIPLDGDNLAQVPRLVAEMPQRQLLGVVNARTTTRHSQHLLTM